MDKPPLRFLHSESSLLEVKLQYLGRLSTEELLTSLKPEREGSLKTRPDGTVLDGHHRLYLLKQRGIDIDALPRAIIPYEKLD